MGPVGDPPGREPAVSHSIDRLAAALSDRYRIERELGAGGMATVFLAEDLKHHRKVALKVLRPELALVMGSQRFLSEIRTTAHLQHPHILPLFDSGEADSLLFYVMPYVEGESLRDRLDREKQLPVEEVIALGRKVAGALQHAHEQGVIHRDIKPENILLGSSGEPLVSDFGIALAVQEAGGGRLTETGLSLGTPYYMSPEQAAGDPALDARSDLYSLGCVLYETLTGQPPFQGSTAQAILGKIMAGTMELPTVHRPTVPPHVEAAILRSLERLPADRFATADAFGRALDDPTLRHPRQEVAGAMVAGSPRAWMRQGLSRVAVALVVLLAGWAASVTFWPSQPPPPAPVVRVVLNGDAATPPFHLSEDGRWLAARPDQGGPIHLRRLDREGEQEISVPLGDAPVGFSPDGRWLLVAGGNGLYRLPVEGGNPVQIVTGMMAAMAAWSDQGVILVSTMDGTFTVPWTGGDTVRVMDEGILSVWWPRFLPGGRYVVFTKGAVLSPQADIWGLDLESGERHLLVEDAFQPQYTSTGHLLFARSNQGIYAVALDPRTLEVTGSPVLVMDSVVTQLAMPSAQYAVSKAGIAVFRRGPPEAGLDQRLGFLVDSAGRADPLLLPAGDIDQVALSPDGGRMAYMREGRIFIYDFLTGSNEPFSSVGSVSMMPHWSRDGSRIAFGYFGPGAPAVTLAIQGLQDSVPAARIEGGAGMALFPLSWTPEGDALLVGQQGMMGQADPDLLILRLGADTTLVPYLHADWAERSGAISPDGRWVAYGSDETGQIRLYVRSFPEPGRRHDIPGYSLDPPHWSADGRTLFWQQGDSMMAVDIRTDLDRQVVGQPRLLFRGPYLSGFDLDPDGRFLMLMSTAGDSAAAEGQPADRDGGRRTVLVVNWIEELQERVGAQGGI
jgi:Tol biopolymer transport system component